MITRGLDPLDAALVRRILQYMDVGLDAMQSDPDWPKVAELAEAAISLEGQALPGRAISPLRARAAPVLCPDSVGLAWHRQI